MAIKESPYKVILSLFTYCLPRTLTFLLFKCFHHGVERIVVSSTVLLFVRPQKDVFQFNDREKSKTERA